MCFLLRCMLSVIRYGGGRCAGRKYRFGNCQRIPFRSSIMKRRLAAVYADKPLANCRIDRRQRYIRQEFSDYTVKAPAFVIFRKNKFRFFHKTGAESMYTLLPLLPHTDNAVQYQFFEQRCGFLTCIQHLLLA